MSPHKEKITNRITKAFETENELAKSSILDLYKPFCTLRNSKYICREDVKNFTSHIPARMKYIGSLKPFFHSDRIHLSFTDSWSIRGYMYEFIRNNCFDQIFSE